MFTKKPIIVLASALLAAEAIAVNMHRHAHQHLHDKRALVYGHTEVIVHTEWVTVTVYDDEVTPTSSSDAVFKATPTTTSTSSSSTSSSSSSSSTPPVVQETPTKKTKTARPTVSPIEETKPTTTAAPKNEEVHAKPTTTSTPPAATSAPPPTSGGSSGSKRGVAYNSAELAASFFGSGTHCSWAYNWGQTRDGLSSSVEYVPMLWGPIQVHTANWAKNAETAISGGSKNFLSFNECDIGSQCNMDAGSAAAAHIKYMNPYSGRVRIGSPAVSNSNIGGQGLDWLKSWISACNGQCAFDFCAIHWYSPADPQQFLTHMKNAYAVCGKPIWITEFKPIDGDASAFLSSVMASMDSSEFGFIERYAYFMASSGEMLSGTSLNAVGNTFAYS